MNTDLDFIQPLKDLFIKAIDFWTSKLRKKNSEYNIEVANRINKHDKKLSYQMGKTRFSVDDTIVVVDFLQSFKVVCDQNGFPEGAATWLFQFFLKFKLQTWFTDGCKGTPWR